MAEKKEPTYYENVYDVVRLIPRGRVTTYGRIADFLTLGSARMVGWALNQALHRGDVPAHRVVNRKGELSGRIHFSTPTLMQELLEAEGVVVVDHQIQGFKELLWSPTSLLDWVLIQKSHFVTSYFLYICFRNIPPLGGVFIFKKSFERKIGTVFGSVKLDVPFF